MGLIDKLFPPPSPDAFAILVMKALKQAGDKREPSYDKKEFQLHFSGQGQKTALVNLRNVYDEFCRAHRSKRGEHLSRITKALLSQLKEVPEDFADARPDLLPVVRSRCVLEHVRLQQKLDGKTWIQTPHLPVGDNMVACLVYDFPEAMSFITDEKLTNWGVSFYEAMEIARHNIAERPFSYANIGDKVFSVMTGDEYDTSRLLIPELVRSMKPKGDPVAILPNRGTLLITGAEDPEGLQIMAELAEKAMQEPRPLCGIPVRLTSNDEWVSWMPEPGHPSEEQYRLLELKTMGGEYTEQKSLLDALHAKSLQDIFVATFTSAQNKRTGKVTSYCVWPEVESLLPKTQKIAFVTDKGPVACAGWEKVQSIVGGLMEPMEIYPARCRVRVFPSERQIEAIGNELM